MAARLLGLSFTGTDEVREGRALPWERPQARPQTLPLPRVPFLSGGGGGGEAVQVKGKINPQRETR